MNNLSTQSGVKNVLDKYMFIILFLLYWVFTTIHLFNFTDNYNFGLYYYIDHLSNTIIFIFLFYIIINKKGIAFALRENAFKVTSIFLFVYPWIISRIFSYFFYEWSISGWLVFHTIVNCALIYMYYKNYFESKFSSSVIVYLIFFFLFNNYFYELFYVIKYFEYDSDIPFSLTKVLYNIGLFFKFFFYLYFIYIIFANLHKNMNPIRMFGSLFFAVSLFLSYRLFFTFLGLFEEGIKYFDFNNQRFYSQNFFENGIILLFSLIQIYFFTFKISLKTMVNPIRLKNIGNNIKYMVKVIMIGFVIQTFFILIITNSRDLKFLEFISGLNFLFSSLTSIILIYLNVIILLEMIRIEKISTDSTLSNLVNSRVISAAFRKVIVFPIILMLLALAFFFIGDITKINSPIFIFTVFFSLIISIVFLVNLYKLGNLLVSEYKILANV